MIQKSRKRERIIAAFIDGLIVSAIVLPTIFLVYFNIKFHIISSLVGLGVGYWYYVIYLFKYETLIGKRNQGLKVFSADGKRITYDQCLRRYLLYNFFTVVQVLVTCYFSLVTPGDGFELLSFTEKLTLLSKSNESVFTPLAIIGQIWIFINFLFFLFEKNRRTLADYFAGTMVGKKVEDEIDTIGKVDPV